MHPSSLLSYYPTYAILDEVLSKGYNELNLYIDLKNVFQSLYMEHSIINLVENTLKSNYTDTSMFAALVSFISFHKVYSARRNIKLNVYVFFESGESFYHTNISKKYKLSRKIDNLYGLDSAKRELFFTILQKNYQLMERAFNLIPRIRVIRLQNLEADFIPYYLITRQLVSIEPNIGHVIYSNDHDMFQTISDHVYVFSKSSKGKKLIKKGDVMKEYLKKETNLDDSYLPIAMAIIGCQGDDVTGIKMIGGTRVQEFVKELVELGGGIETIYSSVVSGKSLFPIKPPGEMNKYIEMVLKLESESNIVSKNLKLVSFEVLSRFFDNPMNTEMLEKREKLVGTLHTNVFVEKDILKESLEKSKIYFENDDYENLFFGIK